MTASDLATWESIVQDIDPNTPQIATTVSTERIYSYLDIIVTEKKYTKGNTSWRRYFYNGHGFSNNEGIGFTSKIKLRIALHKYLKGKLYRLYQQKYGIN